uniref:Uncharacterized protein n=1 Tax=Anopheles christyi TaxID=43041 RepID=A0A182KIY9_9DIPT
MVEVLLQHQQQQRRQLESSSSSSSVSVRSVWSSSVASLAFVARGVGRQCGPVSPVSVVRACACDRYGH